MVQFRHSKGLDGSTDSSDTVQLLIFIRGVNDKFDVITALLSTEVMTGTTTGKDLCDRLSGKPV